MRKIIIDLWYGNTIQDCDGLTYSFSDCDCVYCGNFVKNGQFVGDYTTGDFREIEKLYSRMNGEKRWCKRVSNPFDAFAAGANPD